MLCDSKGNYWWAYSQPTQNLNSTGGGRAVLQTKRINKMDSIPTFNSSSLNDIFIIFEIQPHVFPVKIECNPASRIGSASFLFYQITCSPTAKLDVIY